MMPFKTFFKIIFIFALVLSLAGFTAYAATNDLLSPEEASWLSERNGSIVVYPELNNPPYSYQDAAGNLQGLSIDYLELIAQKVGAKIQYLTPRSRSQILNDVKNGKGDVIAFITPNEKAGTELIFTQSYANVPVIIVVRKDVIKGTNLTLNDFNGKRVAMVNDSAIDSYVNTNYPRVVREGVTDDEIALQQVVLGEVDAAVMDVASLSFYLSKQVLSSVKIAGSTGMENKPAFAMTQDKIYLQSILEKGLSQITVNDRGLINDKWIALPGVTPKENNSLSSALESNLGIATLYVLFGIGILTIIIFVFTHKSHRERYFHRVHNVEELKDEFAELESESNALSKELLEVKADEEKLKEKIQSLRE